MTAGINIIVTRALAVLSLGAIFSASCWLIPSRANAAKVTLDFEGLQNNERVGNFYAGGRGTFRSRSTQDYGIRFSWRALASIDSDVIGAAGGDFDGNPSGNTALKLPQFCLETNAEGRCTKVEPFTPTSFAMNVEQGFVDLFSFYYSAPFNGRNLLDNGSLIAIHSSVSLYDGICDLNGCGNLLGQLDLERTPYNGAPDPTGIYSPFLYKQLSFQGVARSAVFSGTPSFSVYDDISLNLADSPPKSIPTPALLPGLIGMGLSVWRRTRQK
jgi:hypothetical protein